MFLRKHPADPSSLSQIHEHQATPNNTTTTNNNNRLGKLKQRLLGRQQNSSTGDINQENSFSDTKGDMHDNSSTSSIKSPTTGKITKPTNLPQRWAEDQQFNLQTASSTRFTDIDTSKNRPKRNCW